MVLSLDTTASNVALSGGKKIDSYQGKYSCSKYFTASSKSGVENICDRKGEAASGLACTFRGIKRGIDNM
jgi:hypothetical protein